MSVLRHLRRTVVRRQMDEFSESNSLYRGQSLFRMVYHGVNFPVQSNVMFRRYLFGKQSITEDRSVLDEFCLLSDFCRGNDLEMDSVRILRIFQQFMDRSRFHHRLCKCRISRSYFLKNEKIKNNFLSNLFIACFYTY